MYMGGVVKDCMENKIYKRKCIKRYLELRPLRKYFT